uniref:Uncharacterized protein n=1 Tax=Podarcis muralis TaxID=64176 RepID=A0A670HS72_PODMU
MLSLWVNQAFGTTVRCVCGRKYKTRAACVCWEARRQEESSPVCFCSSSRHHICGIVVWGMPISAVLQKCQN